MFGVHFKLQVKVTFPIAGSATNNHTCLTFFGAYDTSTGKMGQRGSVHNGMGSRFDELGMPCCR